MGPSMQWLSLIGGVVIFGYGLFRLDGVPLILGLLIVAFSISKMMKSKTEKSGPKRKDGH
ncbi:MAG: hypothetical protein ACP5SH_05620 [Syntrophobacteraceae bacterium]